MKSNWITIALCGGCLVLGVLLMKSCQNGKVQQIRYEDSLRIRGITIDSNRKAAKKILKERDSVIIKSAADSIKSKRVTDSLSNIVKNLRNKLFISQDSSLTLWKQLRTFYLSGDTASLKTAYYELRAQLDSTNNLMTQIEFQHERIQYNLQTSLDSCHATIRTLSAQLDALKSLFDKQTQIAENQNKEEDKILEKQRKRKVWGLLEKIGIGLAGIFIGKKI